MNALVKTQRHIDYSVHAVHSHGSLEIFQEKEELLPGIHTIWHNNLPIDLQFSPIKDSNTLVVVLHGAADQGVQLPWLSGVGITKDLSVSRLFISDPSLYLDENLRLGWFSGNRFQPNLQEDLIGIFKKFVDASKSKKIIFLGGSGGGFASLFFSNYIKNSTALVFNPQTIIKNYPKIAVDSWLNLAWEKEDLSEVKKECIIDLTELYKNSNNENNIIYLQNSTDNHVHLHAQPFIENYSGNNLYYLEDNWGDGHVPPPKETIRYFLEMAISGRYQSPLVKIK